MPPVIKLLSVTKS